MTFTGRTEHALVTPSPEARYEDCVRVDSSTFFIEEQAIHAF
jgi:hypothetical protein